MKGLVGWLVSKAVVQQSCTLVLFFQLQGRLLVNPSLIGVERGGKNRVKRGSKRGQSAITRRFYYVGLLANTIVNTTCHNRLKMTL